LARSIPDRLDRDIVLLDLAKAQVRSGDISGANMTVRGISDPTFKDLAIDAIAIREAIDEIDSPLWSRMRSWLGHRAPAADTDRVSMALSKLGRWEEAERIARKVADLDRRGFALRDAALARAKSGDFNGAVAMADKDELRSYRAFALLTIARNENDHHRPGNAVQAVDRAMALFRSYAYPVPHAIPMAASELRRAGNSVGAVRSITEAWKLLPLVKDPQEKQYYRSCVLEAYAAVGESLKALSIAKSIQPGPKLDSTVRRIAEASAEAGDPNAISIAQQIKDPLVRNQALRDVALGLAKRKEFGAAARADKLIEDQHVRQLSGWLLSKELAQAGRLDDARTRIAIMQPGFNREHATQDFYRILAASGTVEKTMGEARNGRTPNDRAMGFVGVAQGLMDRDPKRFSAISPYDN
jgi:hypothetical protein